MHIVLISQRQQHWSNTWIIVWRIFSWCDSNSCCNDPDVQKVKISSQKEVSLVVQETELSSDSRLNLRCNLIS